LFSINNVIFFSVVYGYLSQFAWPTSDPSMVCRRINNANAVRTANPKYKSDVVVQKKY